MDANELFFIAEMARHAKSLPISDSIRFMAGAMRSLDEDHIDLSGLRASYNQMVGSADQLDLIQLGQLAVTKERKGQCR